MRNIDDVIHRLQEPSTWRGIVMMLSATGVSVNPEMMESIIVLGMGLSGMIGFFTADKK